ncbi:MAG: hypothetical protein KAS39_05505, partial [Actinomycetia bacterium]|nr:hypothetical protein [Actinomycetes bacterium]
MNKNLKNAYYALWWEMITILFLSLFSGPLKEMGITSLLPFNLEPARRVGRIIFVYHSVAVPFVCALLFLALYILKIEGKEISHLAIPGYVLTTIGGLGFSYFSDEWFLHGL